MEIVGFILSLIALICSFIPFLGIIIAIVALIISIVGLVKNREKGKKALKIAGIVISSIAMIICTVMTIATFSFVYMNQKNVEVINGVKLSLLKSEVYELNQEVALYIDYEKTLDENITIEEIIKRDLLSLREENILYDSNSVKDIEDEELRESIALNDVDKLYYKINNEKLNVSSSINLDDYVIDLEGKVYINSQID